MAFFILVTMGDEDAMIRFAEEESEGVEWPRRSQPDEFVGPQIYRGLEMILVQRAHPAVDAVGGDDQIAAGEDAQIGDLLLEMQRDA